MLEQKLHSCLNRTVRESRVLLHTQHILKAAGTSQQENGEGTSATELAYTAALYQSDNQLTLNVNCRQQYHCGSEYSCNFAGTNHLSGSWHLGSITGFKTRHQGTELLFCIQLVFKDQEWRTCIGFAGLWRRPLEQSSCFSARILQNYPCTHPAWQAVQGKAQKSQLGSQQNGVCSTCSREEISNFKDTCKQRKRRTGKRIKSNLTKCFLCILLLIKYKIYSICQWTVCLENYLVGQYDTKVSSWFW